MGFWGVLKVKLDYSIVILIVWFEIFVIVQTCSFANVARIKLQFYAIFPLRKQIK